MKIKEILYSTALGASEAIVLARDAEKGLSYTCIDCKKEMVLHKSGKVGKGRKRPHYKHKHNETAPNCSPESVLHSSFKKILSTLLDRFRSENTPFNVSWHCRCCGVEGHGNLLARTHSVRAEYTFGNCRPDIALLDEAGKVIAAIEIVVTHEPAPNTIQYFKDSKITLIQINLSSDADLYHVEERSKKPDVVDLCLNRQCPTYDKHLAKRQMQYVPTPCGRLGHLSGILKFQIVVHSNLGISISNDFMDDEIEAVKSRASQEGREVFVKKDEVTKHKYPVIICQECKMMSSSRRRL